MSEYQYYEFQTLDRPLTAEAKTYLKSLSSRVELTATSASFVYHYGSFRGQPYQVLSKYFDAMLYITNWGTRQLMFRFPSNAISDEIMSMYQYAENLEWSRADEYIILNIFKYEEDGGNWGWVNGEGLLSEIIQVRNDILHGDYRALYLAWLMIAELESEILEDDEDLVEPPVPPNLANLSPVLWSLIDFLEVDYDWVTAAAQNSTAIEQPRHSLSTGLDQLPDDEKMDYLRRVLEGEVHLDIKLASRLRQLIGDKQPTLQPSSQARTIRQLKKTSEEITKTRLEKERLEAEMANLKRLEKIAQSESQLWVQVFELIEQKQSNPYSEAIKILQDLRDLAQYRGQLSQFNLKLQDIKNKYPTLRGLHSRMHDAKLV